MMRRWLVALLPIHRHAIAQAIEHEQVLILADKMDVPADVVRRAIQAERERATYAPAPFSWPRVRAAVSLWHPAHPDSVTPAAVTKPHPCDDGCAIKADSGGFCIDECQLSWTPEGRELYARLTAQRGSGPAQDVQT